MKVFRFELWQDGIPVASVEGQDEGGVRAEILRYAMQYRQDGPCQIRGEGVTINLPAKDAIPSVWSRWQSANPQ